MRLILLSILLGLSIWQNKAYGQCSVGIGGTTTICGNSPALLQALGSFNVYAWSNGATTMLIAPTSAGTYTITATDANGCAATASISVTNCAPVSTCPIVIYENENNLAAVSPVVSYNNQLTFMALHSGQSNYPGYPEPTAIFYRGDLVNASGLISSLSVNATIDAPSLFNFVNPQNTSQLILGYRTPLGIQYGFNKHYRVWNGSTFNDELIPPTANSLVWPYMGMGTDGIARGVSFMAAGYSLVYHRRTGSGWNNDAQVTSSGNDYSNTKSILGTDNTVHIFSNWANSGLNRLDYLTVNPTGTTSSYIGWLTDNIDVILDATLDPDNQLSVLFQQGGLIKLAIFVSPTSFNLRIIYASTATPTSADLSYTADGKTIIAFYENNKVTVLEESNIDNRFFHKYQFTNPSGNGSLRNTPSLVINAGSMYACFSDNSRVYAANLSNPQTPTVTISNTAGTLTATVSPTGVYDYTWLLNNSPISGAPNSPSFQPTVQGTYSCSVSNASGLNNCNDQSNQIVFNATNPPNVGISGNTTICTGSTTALNALVSSGTSPYSYLWNTGATTQNITISTGGTYSLTVTDSAGLTGTASTTISTISATATLTATPTSICTGSSAQLTAGGGTTYQWSSNAGNVGNNSTISVSPTTPPNSTTYTVTVTGNNGCTATAATSVSVINSINISDQESAVCNNSTDGTTTQDLDSFFPSLSANITYSPQNGAPALATGNVFNGNGLNPGTYNYLCTYNNIDPCPDDVATVTITVNNCNTCPNPPTAGFDYGTNTSFCIGSGNATVDLDAGATAGNFTATPTGLSLNAGTGTINLSASTAGTYTVTNTIAASGSCPQVVATTSITLVAPPNAGNDNSATVCNTTGEGNTTQDLDNLLSAGVSGGTWTAGSGAPALGAGNIFNGNGLTVGVYTYTYTINGTPPCANDAATITIQVNDCLTCTTMPVATFSYIPNSYCIGSSSTATPQLASGATAGTFTAAPLGLSINAGTGVVNLSASTAGTYTITNTIAASGACPQVTATATLTLAAPPNAGADGSATVCNNSTQGNTTQDLDGLLSAGVSGGTWAAGSGAPALGAGNVFNGNGLTVGAYTYTYTINGTSPCANDAATFTITVNNCNPCPNPPVATFSYTPNSYCIGSSSIAITQLASGATAGTFTAAPAGLSISAGTGVVNLSTSAAGTYTITNTIAASGGCPQVTATATLTLAAPPNAGADGSTTVCNNSTQGNTTQDLDGLLSAGVSGGTWAAGSGAPALGAGNVFNGNGLTAGNYTYTYTINGTSPCANDAATFTITVNNCNACPNPPVATFSYTPNSYCIGTGSTPTPQLASGATAGTFTAAPAGLSISAGTGVVNLSASTAGTYTITNTIAASGACPQVTATATLTINNLPIAIAAQAAPNTNCTSPFNGQVNLATNSTNFVWSNGSTMQSLTGLNGGTYTVTVTSTNGCTNTASATVNNTPNLPTVSAGNDFSICAGSSATLSASGGGTGASYQWVSGINVIGTAQSVTHLPISSTTYSVIVTSSNGCSASDNVLVSVVQAPNAGSDGNATVCNNSTQGNTIQDLDNLLSAGVSGGAWTAGSGAPTLGAGNVFNGNGLTVGTYTYTYTINGTPPCTNDAATFTITVNNCNACPNPPIATFSYTPNSYCVGSGTAAPQLASGATAGTFTAAPAGLSINAGTGVVNLSASTAGTYTVSNTIAASGGCPQVVASAAITVNASPLPTATATPATICTGSSTQLVAGGGSAYLWSTGATTAAINVSPSGNTTYTVTVSSNGCTATTNVSVTVNLTPAANASASPSAICSGQSVTLSTDNAGAGATYQWTAGLNTAGNGQSIPATPIVNTTYTVLVTAANGCTATDNVSVTVNPTPNADLGADQNICGGAGIELSPNVGVGGATYLWSTGANVETLEVSPANTTTYSVTVTSSTGCSDTDAITITVTPNISLNFTPVAAYNASYSSASCLGAPNPAWVSQLDLDTQLPPNASGGTWAIDPDLPSSYYDSNTHTVFFTNNPTLAAGTYTFTYTLPQAAPCNDIVAELQVQVNDCSCPPVLVNTAPINGCVGSDISIDLSSLEINVPSDGHWEGTQVVAGTSNFVLNNAGEGSYTANYVLNNPSTGCPSSSLPIEVIVHAAPGIVVTNAVDTTCAGSTVILGINSNDNHSYQWAGPGISTNNNTPVVAVNNVPEGNSIYTITVTDQFGCQSSTSIGVLAEMPPNIALIAVALTVANEPCPEGQDTLVMETLLAAGTSTTGVWSVVDGPTATGIGTIEARLTEDNAILSCIDLETGDYIFEYSLKNNSCDTVRAQKTIRIGTCCPNPLIETKEGTNEILLYCSIQATTYKWGYYTSEGDSVYLDEVMVNGVSYFNSNEQFFVRNILWENSIMQATNDSTIRYFVETTNEQCNTLSADITLGLQKGNIGGALAQIDLYPNPNTGSFSLLVLHNLNGEIRIRFFNIMGQTVEDILAEKQGALYEKQVFLSDSLPAGVYLVDVSINGVSVGKKQLIVVR